MFSYLLFTSILLSCFCGRYAPDERFVYILIYNTQLGCTLNLFWRDPNIQLVLHDCFVYVLVYGLMCTTNTYTKLFALIISTAMLTTRLIYGRCIFLWWNQDRNIDYDVIILIMTILCCFRNTSFLNNFVCISIGIVSHFLRDAYENSLLKHIL